jgi:hypothetical protein
MLQQLVVLSMARGGRRTGRQDTLSCGKRREGGREGGKEGGRVCEGV